MITCSNSWAIVSWHQQLAFFFFGFREALLRFYCSTPQYYPTDPHIESHLRAINPVKEVILTLMNGCSVSKMTGHGPTEAKTNWRPFIPRVQTDTSLKWAFEPSDNILSKGESCMYPLAHTQAKEDQAFLQTELKSKLGPGSKTMGALSPKSRLYSASVSSGWVELSPVWECGWRRAD